MRTEQDKINRKEANQRYYKLEENKEQKRNYMKAYRTRPYVKAKLHEYYIVNKMHWGEKNKKDKELQDIYNKIFEESLKHMKTYEPQMVAGTLMAIAIRLYKTSLSDEGFHDMLQTILDSEGDIKSFADDKDTVH